MFTEKEAFDILKPKYRVGPSAREVAAPLYDRVKDLPELEKKQYLDLNLWLPGDILLKADKMSMAHSLELRVPYLDREVLREATAYPVNYKIAGDTKAVLRAAANRTLPDAVYVTLRTDQPVNLCGAFEKAVPATANGFVGPSKAALAVYAQKVYTSYADAPLQAFTVGDGLEALAPAQPLGRMLDALEAAVGQQLGAETGNGVE